MRLNGTLLCSFYRMNIMAKTKLGIIGKDNIKTANTKWRWENKYLKIELNIFDIQWNTTKYKIRYTVDFL